MNLNRISGNYSGQKFADWAIPFLLGAIVLIIYIGTWTNWHSGDDIQWVMQVENSVTHKPMLHPDSIEFVLDQSTSITAKIKIRYMLELPLSKLSYSLAKEVVDTVNAVQPLQLTHSLLGTIGILFFFFGVKTYLSRYWSFLLSLGLAFSYAWWYYSTHLDYTILAQAVSCIFFYLLVSLFLSESPVPSRTRAIWLGVISAIGLLSLLTGIALVAIGLLALLLRYYSRNNWGELRSTVLWYISGILLTVILLVSIIWISNPGMNLSAKSIWSDVSYAGASAHTFSLSDFVKSFYGFSKALIAFPLLGNQNPNYYLSTIGISGRVGYYTWYGLVICIGLCPMILLGIFFKNLGRYKYLIIILGAWMLMLFPYVIYWEPTYIKWWTVVLIPWWGLLGLLFVITTSNPSLNKLLKLLSIAGIAIFFATNFFSDFLPNSRANSNPWVKTAENLRSISKPDDLFLSYSDLPLDFYIPYFGERTTLSRNFILLDNEMDAYKTDSLIQEALIATYSRGGRVFLYNCDEKNSRMINELSPDLGRYELIELPVITPQQIKVKFCEINRVNDN
jgi:hypothetical protein